MQEVMIPPEPVIQKLGGEVGRLTVEHAAKDVHIEILKGKIHELEHKVQELEEEVAELEEELDESGGRSSAEPDSDDDEGTKTSSEEVPASSTKSRKASGKKGTGSKKGSK